MLWLVCVGTLLAVGTVEEALVELVELDDVLVDELELVLLLLLLLVVLIDDVVVIGALVGVNIIPVNTCCSSMSVGCPEYVDSTVVAQLDSPQPYW